MTKEALNLALEALEQVRDANIIGLTLTQDYYDAITAIKETLAQPEKERFLVATIGNWGRVEWVDGVFPSLGEKMYSAPPQRTWVGLTEEEIVLIVAECAASHQHTDIHFARAIETKLKEKNT
jgi:hypothetical protein